MIPNNFKWNQESKWDPSARYTKQKVIILANHDRYWQSTNHNSKYTRHWHQAHGNVGNQVTVFWLWLAEKVTRDSVH